MQHTFLRFRKAWWPYHKPKLEDIRRLLTRWPTAVYLANSRQGANDLDALAMLAKYPKRKPLAIVDGDIESWQDNYDKHSKLKKKAALEPRPVPIHIGMYVYTTRNLKKDLDYVNGMRCQVLRYDQQRKAIVVRSVTGKTFSIVAEYDDKLDKVYYPVRPGWASTVMKFQGAELDRLIYYCDKPCVPAAAYTALSRVRLMAHVLIGGRLTPDHFTPAAPDATSK